MMHVRYPRSLRQVEDILFERRRLNNRAEAPHQPFRRREGAMADFRYVETLQNGANWRHEIRITWIFGDWFALD